MNKLLRVSNRRLFKDRLFRIAMAVTLGLSLYISLTNAPAIAEWAKSDEDVALEDCFFNLLPLLGLIYASFVSLFLGVEHSDGGLRNKLIAGHSRSSVFVSLFLTSAMGCMLITALWALGSLPGLFFLDFSFGPELLAQLMLLSLVSAVSFAAIFTTVSLSVQNKALSAVISLVLWFVLLFIGSAIVNLLAVPEMTCDFTWVNGEYIAGPEYPNPQYIGGIKRTILDTLSRILPTCPVIRICDKEFETVAIDIIYSLGTTLAVLFAGCMIFRKEDLK